jgi:hypothetical protein
MNRSMVLAEWNRARESLNGGAESLKKTGDPFMTGLYRSV